MSAYGTPEQDEDEGIKCFTGIKNALVITAVIAAVIFIALAMTGCELESTEKTEITAQSGSIVNVNLGDGSATVSQKEEVVK
jgi:hypothetical protein